MEQEILDSIKAYLKIEDDDSAVLESIIKAVIERCENETGKAFTRESALYLQAVRMITADWYDHRGVTTTEQLKEMPLATHVQSILNHIAISTDYEEVTE